MARLKDKVAIITGAAGGMGEAEARLFAAEGARVLLTDVDESRLKIIVEQITAQGYTAAYLVQDVASEIGWEQVITRAIELFGKIDVLVNNAGITGRLLAPFEQRTLEEFNKVISVNLASQFLGTKAVLPHMRKNGGGSIVNISSIGGIIGSAGPTAYTASKFAKMAVEATPLGRGGQLNEVAYAVLYLASDESTFTTGAEFVIDGGATAL